jgi:hypothetical protein
MTVDTMLDSLSNKVGAFLISFIPYSVVLSLVNLYFGVIMFLKRILAQGQVTFRAVTNSFYPTRLFFYKYDSMYVPVVHRGAEIPPIYGDYEWIYKADESSFISMSPEATTKARRFPYLGGTLIDNSGSNISYIDITDWLSEQRIFSHSDEVPLQLIVAAWAHVNENSVKHRFEGYKIMFMTLDGDEVIFNVSTGEQVSDTDTGPWPGAEVEEALPTVDEVSNDEKAPEEAPEDTSGQSA